MRFYHILINEFKDCLMMLDIDAEKAFAGGEFAFAAYALSKAARLAELHRGRNGSLIRLRGKMEEEIARKFP